MNKQYSIVVLIALFMLAGAIAEVAKPATTTPPTPPGQCDATVQYIDQTMFFEQGYEGSVHQYLQFLYGYGGCEIHLMPGMAQYDPTLHGYYIFFRIPSARAGEFYRNAPTVTTTTH